MLPAWRIVPVEQFVMIPTHAVRDTAYFVCIESNMQHSVIWKQLQLLHPLLHMKLLSKVSFALYNLHQFPTHIQYCSFLTQTTIA